MLIKDLFGKQDYRFIKIDCNGRASVDREKFLHQPEVVKTIEALRRSNKLA